MPARASIHTAVE
jgi:hypothetical protein